MRRTTIMADDAVLELLANAAHAQGRSMGELVREALEEKAFSLAPAPASLGRADSRGRGPAAAEIGDIDAVPESWRSS